MQQHLSPHDQYRQPFVVRIDGGDAVNGYDWTEVVWDRTEYVEPDSPRTGVASLFGLNGAAAPAVDQYVTARFRAISPAGDPTFVFGGDGGGSPQVARVTGAAAAGLYPAVLTHYDQDAETWSDADTVDLKPLNGETLEVGQRYLCVPAAGTPADPPVWLAVATCCGGVVDGECGCCASADMPATLPVCVRFTMADPEYTAAGDTEFALTGTASRSGCDYTVVAGEGDVSLPHGEGRWRFQGTLVCPVYDEPGGTAASFLVSGTLTYVDLIVGLARVYTLADGDSSSLAAACDPFEVTRSWADLSVNYGWGEASVISSLILAVGEDAGYCEPGGGSGTGANDCGDHAATAAAYEVTVAGLTGTGCAAYNATHTLDVILFTCDWADAPTGYLARLQYLSGPDTWYLSFGTGAAQYSCTDAAFVPLGSSTFNLDWDSGDCAGWPATLTVAAVP